MADREGERRERGGERAQVGLSRHWLLGKMTRRTTYSSALRFATTRMYLQTCESRKDLPKLKPFAVAARCQCLHYDIFFSIQAVAQMKKHQEFITKMIWTPQELFPKHFLRKYGAILVVYYVSCKCNLITKLISRQEWRQIFVTFQCMVQARHVLVTLEFDLT